MHCSMHKVFSLIHHQVSKKMVYSLFIFRMMAGLWASIKSCCCGYHLPTTQFMWLLHGWITSLLGVLLSLIWVRWSMAQFGQSVTQLLLLLPKAQLFQVSLSYNFPPLVTSCLHDMQIKIVHFTSEWKYIHFCIHWSWCRYILVVIIQHDLITICLFFLGSLRTHHAMLVSVQCT